MEFCSKCKQSRTINDFFLKPDGSLRRPCKICTRTRQQKHNVKNKEKDRKRYLKEKDERLAKQFKSSYGITLEDYNQLLTKQNNCCALCGNPFVKTVKRPHLDHDHITGKIRGILHPKCNTLLGFANDDTAILAKAIQYLKNQ